MSDKAGTATVGDGAPGRVSPKGAVPALLSSPLALGHSERVERDYWGNSVREHKRLGAIRGFIRDYSDARGGSRLFNSCLQFFYRHTLPGTVREEWRPSCCRGRAVCPHCAVVYGLERGLEVASLFRALVEPEQLLKQTPTVKAFAEVFTLPDWVSEVLDGFVEAKEKKMLLRAVQQLTEALKSTLVGIYGDGVAAKVSWHWWHSPQPLTGPHWHAHVMIPNIDVSDCGRGASVLRSRGTLEPEKLQSLKVLWAKNVFSCKFLADFGQNSRPELVVDHSFLTRNRGKNSLAHRARYDYRHPMQDFCAWIDKRGLPSMTDEGVEWFLSRCEFLQGVQLVRSIGWLTNAKLKKVGLQRFEPETDRWAKDTVHVYQLVKFDSQGAWFKVFNTVLQVDEGLKHVHRSFLKMSSPAKPRLYRWASG